MTVYEPMRAVEEGGSRRLARAGGCSPERLKVLRETGSFRCVGPPPMRKLRGRPRRQRPACSRTAPSRPTTRSEWTEMYAFRCSDAGEGEDLEEWSLPTLLTFELAWSPEMVRRGHEKSPHC